MSAIICRKARAQCDHCEVLNINGVRCHEHGCPDAWKEYKRECGECGCSFVPEMQRQKLCEGCEADMRGDC